MAAVPAGPCKLLLWQHRPGLEEVVYLHLQEKLVVNYEVEPSVAEPVRF